MTTAERFWSKVDIRSLDECWPWKGCLSGPGYGQFRLSGKAQNAHRVVASWALGPPPLGAFTLHACDNRRCVNPLHLRYGTHAENMADMMRRGRSDQALNLTREQVRALMIERRLGLVGTRVAAADAAERYGVSIRTIYRTIARYEGTRPRGGVAKA